MTYKAMVVDDNKAFARMLEKSLPWAQMGVTLCAVAFQGDRALQAIRQHKPDLVITDINMPDRDGLEVMRQVQSELPKTQFILITAHDDFRYAYQAIKQRAFDFLLKPFTRDELCCVIEQAVKKLRGLEEKQPAGYPAGTQRVADYLLAHLPESITQKAVADALNTSVSTLARTVQKDTGMRFGEFLTHLRVETCKRLLQDPAMRVGDIAGQVGYKNYATLHKVFTRIEGVSPSAYRKGDGDENS